ncbi:MAG: tRNA uridine-5-carboxymethylaminomethyl(34) synthesis GTPase MnmE [Verrucomicrobia bacterium]|nr:tRNA uridine-5-carboxymethylaminomethyl(34) synthesis GTPase MnmE [Verrucomicrobiota bacterium]
MFSNDDTIAAIATAPGEAGIAIIRISGPDAHRIADALFRSKARPSEMAGNTFAFGHIHAPQQSDALLDEAILLVYRAPNSFTREHVVEIQSHGGSVAAQRILRATLDSGARLADPGEFTRRAFLNGRIDLLQAEAVADLIRARSDRAAGAALEQLSGRLSSAFNALYDDLIALAADIEATLDFAEEELPETTMPEIAQRTYPILKALTRLLDGWEEGHLLRDGARVVISGRPNVGKSTLMNALLGKNRAIVTAVAGTTRDTIEEQLVLNGIPLRLVDTAGIRDIDCVVEQEGIRRARDSMENADINIHMLDASTPIERQDLDMISKLDPRKTLILLNKTDLGQAIRPQDVPVAYETCRAALLKGEGARELLAALSAKLHIQPGSLPHAVISERHRNLARSALTHIQAAKTLIDGRNGDAPLLASQALREALETLGTITGRTYCNELLDAVFSRFCIGK